MDEEERAPVRPVVLDRMGVAELEAYIAGLQQEIARAQAHIDAKQGHRSAADSFFNFK